MYCILIVDVSHIGFGGQEGPILNKNHFCLSCYDFNGRGKPFQLDCYVKI